jgi:AAA ATPase-like protein
MKGRVLESNAAKELAVPLVGRQEEVRALSSALRSRQSRLILGPPGIGKTRLIEESLSSAGQPFVWVERWPVLHDLLVELAEKLVDSSSGCPDFRRATTVGLKPLVLGALGKTPRCVVLEAVAPTEPRMYRFLRELYYIPGCCLMATARTRDSLGHLRKLLWDPREEIEVKPLTQRQSIKLFERACDAFSLESVDLHSFQEKVIDAALGNPGQILAMCRLAAQPEYRNGRRIKFAPLRIDVASAFVP